MKKAVVLLSGGLDSATTLAIARNQEFECYALSLDYGQRHRSELKAAQNVAHSLNSHTHQIIKQNLNHRGLKSVLQSLGLFAGLRNLEYVLNEALILHKSTGVQCTPESSASN